MGSLGVLLRLSCPSVDIFIEWIERSNGCSFKVAVCCEIYFKLADLGLFSW